MTRQRRYQLRKKSEGRCVICGNAKAEDNATYCIHHRELIRSRQARNRNPLTDPFPEALWSKALDNFIH